MRLSCCCFMSPSLYAFRCLSLFCSPIQRVGYFEDLQALRLFNSPIGFWNTSNVTNMNRMFAGTLAFNQSIANEFGRHRWTFIVTQYKRNARNKLIKILPSYVVKRILQYSFPTFLGGWETSRVTTMRHMFAGALSFNQPLGQWNVQRVEDMEGMFLNAPAMTCA